jgi:glycosyltransferase involved in cell wall biosynthesis
MAMGKATIAPRWPSVEAIIDHATDGYLFPPSDLSALNSAVLHLTRDREMRERLGRQARLKMEQQFTWHDCAQRFRSACAAAVSAHQESATESRARQPKS